MKANKYILQILFSIYVVPNALMAQVIEIPLPNHSKWAHSLRIKADSVPIDLPIWDDFSTSNGLPDTSFWVSNPAVFVNPGIGKNPPSLNVATFDGWDAFGNAYSQDPEAKGLADSLLSRPLNMSKIPQSLQNTVFISFYYQKEGLGDAPNEEDSLILQFKDIDGDWNTVWPDPNDPLIEPTEFFIEKIIQVPPQYHYDGFQFKFQSHARLNGPFDTWNVDYIYLDKRRSIADLGSIDRSFVSVPSSIFGPYTSVPIKHFFENPQSFLDSSQVLFTNLERQVQPVEYSVFTKDLATGVTVDTLLFDSAFLALRWPLGRRTLKAGPLDPSKLDSSEDSIYLQTTYQMDSGDDFLIDSVFNGGLDTARYAHIDLRVNDTTSVFSVLEEYYAYDDGTAEFGAGVNQLNGSLVLQYITQTPGTVTAIDINFQDIGGTTGGVPIDLFVTDSLIDNRPPENITGEVVQFGGNINDFVTYNLTQPTAVIDTFYIGFRQSSANFVGVGLDKNADNGDRVFFNVAGVWESNTEIEGSLMMRPRFGNNPVTGIGNDLIIQDEVKVYPNPTQGLLAIDSEFDEIRVFNTRGQELHLEVHGKSIDFTPLPPSIYILKIRTGVRWRTLKVVRSN